MSGESIVQLVRTRLTASDLTEGARRFALAAVAGETLAPPHPSVPEAAMTTADGSVPGFPGSVWLRRITVRGFRGIGPASTLLVEPGPGLTLVMGRNGSGKSSFAEGIEIALTGRNERLKDKTADWQKQWRNIHDGMSAEVSVEFQVDGESRPLTVRRSWTGKNIEDAVSAVTRNGEMTGGLQELDWSSPLGQYRPFLSYDDLGKASAKPSAGFDLLLGVLGLEAITEAQDRLTAARTELGKTVSEPRDALPALLTNLSTIDDDRAGQVTRALTSGRPDVQEVRGVLAQTPDEGAGNSVRVMLTRLTSLPALDIEAIRVSSGELRTAATAVEGFKGTDTDEAARLADLLDAALAHHASHGDGPCPVCGQGTLDASWRSRTGEEIGRLRKRATEAIAARGRLGDALRRARELIQPVPSALTGAGPDGIDRSEAATAWRAWAALTAEDDAVALAEALGRLAPTVTQLTATVRDQAAAGLRTMEDAWRPAAARVQGWLDLHERAETAGPEYRDISSALAWVKDQAEQLRDERLAPFSEQSARIWANLRQESNVDLGPIAFAGSGRTRRKLDVPVQIDGVNGGVPMLSNGELHALGLSLFLPRSTAPDSPFRFVIIDDPVQAMDPSKVEGLAQVLHETAADRQVIVLTHDDRLAEALRRLMLPTTILEVTRREASQVEIVPNHDPVRRYLDDAQQIARARSLPDDLAAIAAAGSCRDAIEVACQRVARRRLSAAAIPVSEVDELLLRAPDTMNRMALALLGNSSRTGQVMPTLNRLAGGRWAGDVLRAVREGAHQARPDLESIIQDSERLCDLVLGLPVP